MFHHRPRTPVLQSRTTDHSRRKLIPRRLLLIRKRTLPSQASLALAAHHSTILNFRLLSMVLVSMVWHLVIKALCQAFRLRIMVLLCHHQPVLMGPINLRQFKHLQPVYQVDLPVSPMHRVSPSVLRSKVRQVIRLTYTKGPAMAGMDKDGTGKILHPWHRHTLRGRRVSTMVI